MNETLHTARARRSIASWHCCCCRILQSVMPTFTEPKQQGADDMCCCIARLERVAVMSAANKFSLPRRPVPVGHGHEASCIGPPAALFFFALIPSWSLFFFAQRPQCYLNTCAVPGLLSRRKQEWSRPKQDTADGEKGFCPSSRCQTLVKLPRWILSKPTIHLTLDCRPTVSDEATSLLSEDELR